MFFFYVFFEPVLQRAAGCGIRGARLLLVPVLRQSYSGRWPTTAGNSRSVKQDSVPVWQAAPTWSTWTSSASPSQSRATDFTNW